MNNLDQFRAKLREKISREGTQAALGRSTGIPQCVISRFLSGKSDLSGRHMLSLYDYVQSMDAEERAADVDHRVS